MNNTIKRNIGLIGFMGTGKTTVGRVLANELQREFIDTDVLIEMRAGKTIAEIFSEDGEEDFRRMESAVVREVCNYEASVISFGGGVAISPLNVQMIRRSATLVLLKASAEVIASRVLLHKTRPLLDSSEGLTEQIRDLLRNREAVYQRVSDVVIETGTMGAGALALEVIRRLDL